MRDDIVIPQLHVLQIDRLQKVGHDFDLHCRAAVPIAVVTSGPAHILALRRHLYESCNTVVVPPPPLPTVGGFFVCQHCIRSSEEEG